MSAFYNIQSLEIISMVR